MALSKHYSTKENLSERQKEICREMVAELYRQDYLFAYYQKLSERVKASRLAKKEVKDTDADMGRSFN